MADTTNMNLGLVVILFVLSCIIYFKSTSNYWKNRQIPYIQPIPIFGNTMDLFFSTKSVSVVFQNIYDQLHGHKYGGYFHMGVPTLLVRDSQLVEKILVKDFNHFVDRVQVPRTEDDAGSSNVVMGESLFEMQGESWRNLRYKLSPFFTTAKLKAMFDQICNCGGEIIKTITEFNETGKAVDGQQLMSKFVLDVVASCFFGLQFTQDDEASKNIRSLSNHRLSTIMSSEHSMGQICRLILLMYARKLAHKLGLENIPKEANQFFTLIVKQTLKYREQNQIVRNDFLQFLLNLYKNGRNGIQHSLTNNNNSEEKLVPNQCNSRKDDENDRIEDKEKVFIIESLITTQAFTFLTTGFETISRTLNYCLYCLAQNPHTMDKLHEEIDSVLENHNYEWSYKAVKEMTYLDNVIQETLRIYPVSPILHRVCTEDYRLPDTNYLLEKGTPVLIPIRAIQNDPENYESPDVFNPDRFRLNNFNASGIYLPFGYGPRSCIALRFSILELKVVLARIMAEYTVILNSKTELPLGSSPNNVLLQPKGKLFFDFHKRLKI